MRIASGRNWRVYGAGMATLLLALLPTMGSVASAAPASGGVTLSPATVTLTLPAGRSQQQASFTITNHYASAIVLHFAFTQPVATPGATHSAVQQLSVTPTDASVAAGGSVSPVITLADNAKLAPGSQQVDLAINQENDGSSSVNVVPRIAMPLVVVKEAGAVTSFAVSSMEATHAAVFGLPTKAGLTVKNTGNVIVIPRGFTSLINPRGQTVAKGVLNTASAAVAPGGQLYVSTHLVALERAWTPGSYRLVASFGTGGGAPAKTATTNFVYVPAWEVSLLAVTAGLGFCVWRIRSELLARRRRKSTATISAVAAPILLKGDAS